MTCESCVKSVSDSLYSLEGITKVDANLQDQLVAVEGTGKDRPPMQSWMQQDWTDWDSSLL